MDKLKIALFDCDEVYGERFLLYILRHRAQEIDLHVYSSIELEKAQRQMEEFDFVLAGSGFAEIKPEEKVIYLSDVCSDVQDNSEREKNVLSKYQPIEQLLHEIYIRAGYLRNGQRKSVPKSGMEVIGVCSPAGHEMQELFSVLYAINLKQERKVLYLNFLQFSGFREMFGQLTEYDIGDVILRMRNGKLSQDIFWHSIGEISGISYLQPFGNPENIKQIQVRDLEDFLAFVQENTSFSIVIMDFGMSMPELSECLMLCDTIFLPGKEGYFYRCRENAFFEWLEKSGQKELETKIQSVSIPYSAKNIRGGSNVIEQLQWSEFGDFVRGYSGKRENYAADDAGDSDASGEYSCRSGFNA